MRTRIVYTRVEDGGVTIRCPTDDVVRWMGAGGLWAHEPRGFVDCQIERRIGDGHAPDIARRFVHALAFGGLSEGESLAVIRDVVLGRIAGEFWDVSDIPSDRWFRDAWCRSHNGGPIMVDLAKAKPIQFRRIKAVVDLENSRRRFDLERFDDVIEPKWGALRDRIHKAECAESLKHVWPDELVVNSQ